METATAFKPFGGQVLSKLIFKASLEAKKSVGAGSSLKTEIHIVFPYYFVGQEYESIDQDGLQSLRERTYAALINCAVLEMAVSGKTAEDAKDVLGVFCAGKYMEFKYALLIKNKFADKRQRRLTIKSQIASNDDKLVFALELDLIRSDPKYDLLLAHFPGT